MADRQTGRNMETTETGRKGGLPYGLYADIARRLRPKVTRQYVAMVARGERKNARVSAALRRAREKYQAEANTREVAA